MDGIKEATLPQTDPQAPAAAPQAPRTPVPPVFTDAFKEPANEAIRTGPTYPNSPDIALSRKGEKVVVQESTGIQQEYDRMRIAMVNVQGRIGGRLESVEPTPDGNLRITFKTGQSFEKPIDELI